MNTEEKKSLKARLGSLIAVKRTAAKYSKGQLGRLINVSTQSISNYEYGKSLPSKRKLKDLIEVLNINIEELKESDNGLYRFISDELKLLQEEEDKMREKLNINPNFKEAYEEELFKMLARYSKQVALNNSYSLNSWIDIPVFSSITSGDLEQNQEVIGKTRIPSEWLYGEHTYFGLKVNDDRNIPYFIEGDILIAQQIDDKYTLGNDEFVIFNINGSNARVGRYHTTGNQVSISFVNESYKPQEISVFDTLKIIGVVKELRRRVV